MLRERWVGKEDTEGNNYSDEFLRVCLCVEGGGGGGEANLHISLREIQFTCWFS